MKSQTQMLLAVMLGCTVAAAVVVRRHLSPAPVPEAMNVPPPAPAPEVAVTPTEKPAPLPVRPQTHRPIEPPIASADTTPAPEPAKKAAPIAPAKRPPVAANSKAANNTAGAAGAPKPPRDLANPDARVALSFVGADPIAEQVWATAINDPSVPEHERSDLIEDLNEDGFPDPKNVTMDDVPLIVSRINLIEQMAPSAMDDVNAAAFAEAYKDLNNMLVKLARN